MKSLFILQQRPWALETVNLGRFVQSTAEPQRDYHDTEGSSVEPLVTNLGNIKSQFSASAGSSFKGGLEEMLAFQFSKERRANINVESIEAKVYQLQNQSSWFKGACSQTPTRNWLEETFNDGCKAFLIVGFLTLLNAQTTQERGSNSSTSGTMTAPVSAALTATGIVLPITVGNPSVGGSKNQSQQSNDEYLARGEMVFAIEYRRVRLDGFFRRTVDKVSLKENEWISRLGTNRTNLGGENKILTAELDKDEIWDEVENEELENIVLDISTPSLEA